MATTDRQTDALIDDRRTRRGDLTPMTLDTTADRHSERCGNGRGDESVQDVDR